MIINIIIIIIVWPLVPGINRHNQLVPVQVEVILCLKLSFANLINKDILHLFWLQGFFKSYITSQILSFIWNIIVSFCHLWRCQQRQRQNPHHHHNCQNLHLIFALINPCHSRTDSQTLMMMMMIVFFMMLMMMMMKMMLMMMMMMMMMITLFS